MHVKGEATSLFLFWFCVHAYIALAGYISPPLPPFKKVKMTVHVKSFFFLPLPTACYSSPLVLLLFFVTTKPYKGGKHFMPLPWIPSELRYTIPSLYVSCQRAHTHTAVFLSFLLPLNFVSGFRFNAVNACVRAFLLFFLLLFFFWFYRTCFVINVDNSHNRG